MTNPAPNVQPSPRAPKAALLSLVQKLSGVHTEWREDKGQALPGTDAGTERARIWLRWNSGGSIGTDEQRTKSDPTTGGNRQLLVGQRQMTLSMRAESFDANLEALDLCERVRFRLRTQVARAIFSPALLSLRDVQPIIVLPASNTADGRVVKTATMDIRWNYVVFNDPLDPGEGDYIATVNGGGIIPGRAL